MSIVPFPSPLGILGQFVVGLLKGDKKNVGGENLETSKSQNVGALIAANIAAGVISTKKNQECSISQPEVKLNENNKIKPK